MYEIWTMGEILVEIMRPKPEMQLNQKGEFLGPFPSGAPAIFIDTVARLGHSSAIIGGVARDEFGNCVVERLKKDGVCCDHIKVYDDKATAVAFVTYFNDGSRKFIYHIDGTPAVLNTAINADHVKKAKFFHVMGCSLMANEKFREGIISTMKEFVENGAKISFDPNIRPELLSSQSITDIVDPIIRNCSVLLPGVEELQLLSGESDIDQAVRKLFENKKLEIIALKRGKNGCTIYSKQGRFDLGVYAINPVDPTGAGDCFDAGFLCGLLENKALKECAQIATAAGALNTAAFGPMEGNININLIKELIARANI
jgi:tagatose kinase